VNDSGQAVGFSIVGGLFLATEWSGGSVINLVNLPGSTNSVASGSRRSFSAKRDHPSAETFSHPTETFRHFRKRLLHQPTH
jgi:hypothetical protein